MNKRRQERRRQHTPEQREEERRRHRAYKLAQNYGLTPEDFRRMLTECDNKCQVCGEPGRLNVDHCHETHRVRGILCVRCNTGIGSFRDEPELLIKAAAYLSKV